MFAKNIAKFGVLGTLLPVGLSAATVSLNDLASATADATAAEGLIAGTVVNGFPIDSTQDVTFQFEVNIKSTNPAGERVFFEFGGGNGIGSSLVYSGFNDTLRFQSEQTGVSALGSLLIPLSNVPLNQPLTITASIDLSEARLNLFIGETLYTTIGTALTDWAGGNEGGFFAIGGNSALKPNFSNAASPEYTSPLSSEAEALSELRIYGNTFVDSVPEPSSIFLVAIGGLGLIRRHR